ncbi:MAG: Bug family tripartite tricarboxylate transporter substrate binding protein, partial [Dehalococcoidia bacterium]
MMPCTRGGKLLGTRLALSACGALLLVLAACADAAPTAEQTTGAEGSGGEAAAPFEGQTVEFVVPYEPGGGYDQYVRIIAPYLGDCLGADVIAVNEPGAGSLLATNQTAVAEPDGTRIQILNTIGAVSAQVAEEEGARYDLADFSWLARIAGEPNVLSVSANSDFQDFDDLINAEEPVRF